MVFDRAFHVVAAKGDAVYFGSSADDQVYCLDAASGQKRWTFFTEAPVRFAPAVVKDRVFVGSDDGSMYCVAAADGKLVYRCQPPAADYRLAGNGRVMSLWAVRTGVIVKDDVAYFGHGLYPKEGVFVRAVRASDGHELWRTPIADRPAQGYMLASDERLYVATGRENPLVFDRKTGKQLAAIEGAGGTYALLTGDTLGVRTWARGPARPRRAGRKGKAGHLRRESHAIRRRPVLSAKRRNAAGGRSSARMSRLPASAGRSKSGKPS